MTAPVSIGILNFFKRKYILPKPNSAVADILGPESLSEANENVRKIIDTPNKSAEMPKTPG